MSRPLFIVRHDYIGANNQAAYTFDFKIEDVSYLRAIIVDNTGIQLLNARGDDVAFASYVSVVEFDPEVAGGTVTLAANLATGYRLILLLANEEPTQPAEWRQKFSFTLKSFELALDRIAGAVQRLSYDAGRTIRLNDADPNPAFNPQLPTELEPNRMLMVGPDGLTIVQGPTPDELSAAADAVAAITALAAQVAIDAGNADIDAAAALAAKNDADAAAAQAQADAADAAQSAIDAANAAASFAGFITAGPFTIPAGMTVDLSGEQYDTAVHRQVDFIASIVAGVGRRHRAEFSIFKFNTDFAYADGPQRWSSFGADPEVSFGLGIAGQITATNTGADDAEVYLKKLYWTA